MKIRRCQADLLQQFVWYALKLILPPHQKNIFSFHYALKLILPQNQMRFCIFIAKLNTFLYSSCDI